MKTKIVEFSLIKEDATLTQRQQDEIEMMVKLYDWENFKDLVSVEFVNIGKDFFIVKVEEINDKWHGRFSQLICNKAKLENLRVFINDNFRLFNTNENEL